jgi:hypothetical protein
MGRCACLKSGHPYTCGDIKDGYRGGGVVCFKVGIEKSATFKESQSETCVELSVCFYVFNAKIETCTFYNIGIEVLRKS